MAMSMDMVLPGTVLHTDLAQELASRGFVDNLRPPMAAAAELLSAVGRSGEDSNEDDDVELWLVQMPDAKSVRAKIFTHFYFTYTCPTCRMISYMMVCCTAFSSSNLPFCPVSFTSSAALPPSPVSAQLDLRALDGAQLQVQAGARGEEGAQGDGRRVEVCRFAPPGAAAAGRGAAGGKGFVWGGQPITVRILGTPVRDASGGWEGEGEGEGGKE
ncbi:unnamed protein product [Closterium sp. NIES-54]